MDQCASDDTPPNPEVRVCIQPRESFYSKQVTLASAQKHAQPGKPSCLASGADDAFPVMLGRGAWGEQTVEPLSCRNSGGSGSGSTWYSIP